MTIALYRATAGDGPAEELVVAMRRGTTRGPCDAWIPVPDEERPDPASLFSESEWQGIKALTARHTSCEFYEHLEDRRTVEWDEIWSESKARDPFGECRIKELGDSLRRRRQRDPSIPLFIDPFFPRNSDSLLARCPGLPPGKPFLSAEELAEVEWKRPADILDPHDSPKVNRRVQLSCPTTRSRQAPATPF
jgi:hypothetical protein